MCCILLCWMLIYYLSEVLLLHIFYHSSGSAPLPCKRGPAQALNYTTLPKTSITAKLDHA